MFKFLPPVAFLFAAVSSVMGITYTDNFTTGTGPLNGRTTAAGFGNWISGTELSVSTGRGIYQSAAAPFLAASFRLPVVDLTSQISIRLTMTPTGSSGNLVGFGFTNAARDFVTTQGNGLAYLNGAGSGNDGLVAISSGYSVQGDNVYYANPFSAFNGALPTTFTLDYTVASGALRVTAANNAQTFTLYNGVTGWTPNPGPGADNPIPYQTYLNYFTVQFENQTTGLTGGSINSLSVSVVPEPSPGSCVLGALAIFAVVHIVRRRAVTLG